VNQELREYFRSTLRVLGESIKSHRKLHRSSQSIIDKSSSFCWNTYKNVAHEPSKQDEVDTAVKNRRTGFLQCPAKERVTALLNIYHALRGNEYRHSPGEDSSRYSYYEGHYLQELQEKFDIEVPNV